MVMMRRMHMMLDVAILAVVGLVAVALVGLALQMMAG